MRSRESRPSGLNQTAPGRSTRERRGEKAGGSGCAIGARRRASPELNARLKCRPGLPTANQLIFLPKDIAYGLRGGGVGGTGTEHAAGVESDCSAPKDDRKLSLARD